jgi:hypothetical protein
MEKIMNTLFLRTNEKTKEIKKVETTFNFSIKKMEQAKKSKEEKVPELNSFEDFEEWLDN